MTQGSLLSFSVVVLCPLWVSMSDPSSLSFSCGAWFDYDALSKVLMLNQHYKILCEVAGLREQSHKLRLSCSLPSLEAWIFTAAICYLLAPVDYKPLLLPAPLVLLAFSSLSPQITSSHCIQFSLSTSPDAFHPSLPPTRHPSPPLSPLLLSSV